MEQNTCHNHKNKIQLIILFMDLLSVTGSPTVDQAVGHSNVVHIILNHIIFPTWTLSKRKIHFIIIRNFTLFSVAGGYLILAI